MGLTTHCTSGMREQPIKKIIPPAVAQIKFLKWGKGGLEDDPARIQGTTHFGRHPTKTPDQVYKY